MPDKAIVRAFMDKLKHLGAEGASFAKNGTITYNALLEAYIEALYKTLKGAILTRLILEGRSKSVDKMSPKEAIISNELICREILSQIGDDLSALDSKHEYSVGILKHEKGAKPGNR